MTPAELKQIFLAARAERLAAEQQQRADESTAAGGRIAALMDGWKIRARSAAREGATSFIACRVYAADGVTENLQTATASLTADPTTPARRIIKGLRDAGFNANLESVLYPGSAAWDFQDAEWTHYIRVTW